MNNKQTRTKATNDKQVLIRMPSQLRELLDELANDDQVTVTDWIREAIYQRIEAVMGTSWPRY